MNKKRGLGRGLEALLPGTAADRDGSLKEIEIDKVVPNTRQPRQVLNDEKLSELAESIKEHGIVQPVVVRPLPDGKYELIAGERRWRACRAIGMRIIPAVIREYGDLEAAAVALIENIQRENLNPLEEARAYRILMEDFDLTQEDVSKRVGKSRPFVGNMVRLLTLPDEIQRMVMDGHLSAGHARAILGISEREKQIGAAKRIIRSQMNVRQAESLIKNIAAESSGIRKKRTRNREYKLLEKDLNSILPAIVRIREKKDGGARVLIDFKTPGEMLKCLAVLKNDKIE